MQANKWSYFLIFIIISIYSYLYLCIYTFNLTNQHFKAFLVSKFNSETSFLYQLFKENSNFIVTEPCKIFYKSIFFMIFIIIYIYAYVYWCIYTPSYQHFKTFPVSKWCLNSIPRPVFCINFSRRIQIS